MLTSVYGVLNTRAIGMDRHEIKLREGQKKSEG
jgi:hypothetical protein